VSSSVFSFIPTTSPISTTVPLLLAGTGGGEKTSPTSSLDFSCGRRRRRRLPDSARGHPDKQEEIGAASYIRLSLSYRCPPLPPSAAGGTEEDLTFCQGGRQHGGGARFPGAGGASPLAAPRFFGERLDSLPGLPQARREL
jgi:hypothetical protein